MAPKDSPSDATDNGGPKLTENDIRVLQLSWQCFETMPKVNTAKLAELGGWKTAASANTAFHNAKKRLLGDIRLPPAEKTPKKGAAASKKNASNENGEGEGEDEEEVAVDSPVAAMKKKKATPRKRKVEAEIKGEDGEDGDEEAALGFPVPVKKKVVSRKRRTGAATENGDEPAVVEETPQKKKRASRKKLVEVEEEVKDVGDHTMSSEEDAEMVVKAELKAEDDEVGV